MSEAAEPPLGETMRDRAVALTKGGVGAIPLAGGLIAEIVGEIVPNQRLARIEAYLRHLNQIVGAFSVDQKSRIKEGAEYIDLIEEGAVKAARTLTDERRVQVASIVASGVSGDEQKALDQKRLLSIYAELDENDIIILLSYDMINRVHNKEFYSKHNHLFEPLYATIHSPLELRERAAMREAIQIKLERLGLTKDEQTFKIKAHAITEEQMIETRSNMKITTLGRIVLREAGVLEATRV